jgi:hypothetical protein
MIFKVVLSLKVFIDGAIAIDIDDLLIRVMIGSDRIPFVAPFSFQPRLSRFYARVCCGVGTTGFLRY